MKTGKQMPGVKLSGSQFDRIASRKDLGRVRRDEPLKSHSNWKIGGPADIYIEPDSEEQISRVIKLCREEGVPLVIIGDGTNLLFDDEGVRGIVLNIGRSLSQYSFDGNLVRAQAGVWVPKLARASASHGLSGLEHTIGIPGTIGGLIWMNGGSMRRGIGENIVSVTVIDQNGCRKTLARKDCGFSYRKSAFQDMDAVIVGADIELVDGDMREIKSSMLGILRARSGKFPRKMPNCGSVFISVGELYENYGPPGKVIENLGFKGKRVGGAEVSELHANFIVNRGGAGSADVLELIRMIRLSVHEKTNIWMNCEVRYVSPAGEITPAHMALAS